MLRQVGTKSLRSLLRIHFMPDLREINILCEITKILDKFENGPGLITFVRVMIPVDI